MAQVYVGTRIETAVIAGKSAEMDRFANNILDKVRASAARHRDTGEYMRGLKVETAGKGKDRLVVAESEGVVPIEFGGIIRRSDGSVRIVKPLRIMRDAYAAVKRIG